MKRKDIKMLGIPSAFVFVTLLSGFFQGCQKETKTVLPPVEDEIMETWTPGNDAFVWVDAQANVFQGPGRFRDKDDIKLILDSLKHIGINGLVLDVKHNTGFTLYESAYTQKLSSYNGQTMLPDYVEFMVNEARSRQMKIYFGINTFVYGNSSTSMGYVYNNPAFKQYESIVANASGERVPISTTGGNFFLNPAAEEVQELTINIIKEMATKFHPDGVVLDYCRYRGIDADFSDLSKELFIQFLEEKYNDSQAKFMDFPKDIVSSWKVVSGNAEPNATGKYYKKWLYFRAKVLRDFFARTRQELKAVAPNVELGAYSGAWYSSYYQQGNNYASETYDPFYDEELTFSFAIPGYKETGYAEQLDLFFSGNYYKQLYLKDNPATTHLKYHWWSIEGSMNGIEYITRNKTKVYSGIDVGNVTFDSEADISEAIKYMYNRSNGGVLVFDVCHVTVPRYNPLRKGLWDALENGLKKE